MTNPDKPDVVATSPPTPLAALALESLGHSPAKYVVDVADKAATACVSVLVCRAKYRCKCCSSTFLSSLLRFDGCSDYHSKRRKRLGRHDKLQ